MTEHRVAYQRELAAIEGRIVELFSLVAEDLPKATGAVLEDAGADALDVLAVREQAIDMLYLEVEDIVHREIALQAPVAADLRFLLSALRIAPELERSHDLVMQVSRRGRRVPGPQLPPDIAGLVARMGELTEAMWRAAADSVYQRDAAAVAGLRAGHEEMAQLGERLTGRLQDGELPLPVTMEMTLIAWFYGRLAAHAVNIARKAAFLAGAPPPAGQPIRPET